MVQRAKILNEVINAKITDIMLPNDFKYNHDNWCEVNGGFISIILDNGEILQIQSFVRLERGEDGNNKEVNNEMPEMRKGKPA